jgi:glycosyltransferase involved in cell wall biosynthesis
MNAPASIDGARAPVTLFAKGGRDFRLDRQARGNAVPREFFYGFFDLERAGILSVLQSTAGPVAGPVGAVADLLERVFARATGLGVRPLSLRLNRRWMSDVQVAISFTDGFSLSLGLDAVRGADRPVLIGGFHGLSDIEARSNVLARPLVRRLIARSLAALDHVFFFGALDRQTAIERYGLTSERSSVIPFGVDTDFWHPMPDEQPQDFVVALGQDLNRDFDLLAAAPGDHPTRIVTRRPVNIPAGATHVQTTVGDFFGSDSMSDEDVRRLYNVACAVVVPVHDVIQPSGYSVSLQAMSCGRPVIISRIRGLWCRDVLRDGENCLLVPPGDSRALGEAIGRVRTDRGLAARLGQAARKTALAHFGLDKIGGGTVALAKLGLALYAERGLAANASRSARGLSGGKLS